eukprot:scaffold87983_cov75-Phaeocystis_antarctica.AAC.2
MADGEAELRERASEAREADGRRRGWRTFGCSEALDGLDGLAREPRGGRGDGPITHGWRAAIGSRWGRGKERATGGAVGSA